MHNLLHEGQCALRRSSGSSRHRIPAYTVTSATLPALHAVDRTEDDPVVLHLVLVTIIRVLSKRLRDTNALVGSVEKLSEWLASSMV